MSKFLEFTSSSFGPNDLAITTGGTITESNGYVYHTFTSSGTFTSNIQLSKVDYLIVAGGGSGGNDRAGGGGAGGYISFESQNLDAGSYSIVIGAGGVITAGSDGNNFAGNNGSNSSFNSLTAIGGGGGGGYSSKVGKSGGSGGGGAGDFNIGGSQVGGAGTSGQGNNGGTGALRLGGASNGNAGGGGGGAGAIGQSANSITVAVGGNGGIGKRWLNGSYYAGGGGGGGDVSVLGYGALGGGGVGLTGFSLNTFSGVNGQANTGGGGGGTNSSWSGARGGNGGSGIVIIRYPKNTLVPTGGEIVQINGYRYHTFKSSGNFIVPSNIGKIEYLIIAGGGAGGVGYGGGGGAGGYRHSSQAILPAGSYSVVVGAGGNQSNGSNSSFNSVISIGGGRGGNFYAYNSTDSGQAGGSGGGGSSVFGASGIITAGAGTSEQGNNGGTGARFSSGLYAGAGGGGAGAIGQNGGQRFAGNGGIGVNTHSLWAEHTFTGVSGYYAAGGGGSMYVESGADATRSSGGTGGGGSGRKDVIGSLSYTAFNSTPGIANTGSGGGGGSDASLNNGSGGSGIVIIRYPVNSISTNTLVNSGIILRLDASNTNSYPGSGTTWTDLSGNGNNATLINGPTFSSANNGCIVLDGTNDYLTTSTLPSGTNSFTLSAWIYLNTVSGNFAGEKAAIVFSGNALGTLECLIRTINANNNYVYRIGMSAYGVANTGSCSIENVDMALNRYHNITFIRDGAASQKIYLNGKLLVSGNISNSFSTGTLHIGAAPVSATYSGHINGRIAHILQYNRALSASEVLQNFNALKSRFSV